MEHGRQYCGYVLHENQGEFTVLASKGIELLRPAGRRLVEASKEFVALLHLGCSEHGPSNRPINRRIWVAMVNNFSFEQAAGNFQWDRSWSAASFAVGKRLVSSKIWGARTTVSKDLFAAMRGCLQRSAQTCRSASPCAAWPHAPKQTLVSAAAFLRRG